MALTKIIRFILQSSLSWLQFKRLQPHLALLSKKNVVFFFVLFFERWYSYDLRKFKLKVSPIAFNNSFGMFQLLTTGKNVERIGCNEEMFSSSAIRGLVIARLLDVHFTRQC